MGTDFKQLKQDMDLIKKTTDLSKAFDADNRQKTFAIIILVFMVIMSFFASLASTSFDWHSIGTAKFWFNFAITFGGAQFLKFVWGKYGFYAGYQEPKVVEELERLSTNNKNIRNNDLVGAFDSHIDASNLAKKFKAFKDLVYKKALKRPKSAYWEEQKEIIRLQERLDETLDVDERAEIVRELEDKNFSLENLHIYKYSFFGLIPHKLKYPYIDKGAIGTGFESTDLDDDDDLSFSEMYQLYGKNAIFTVATTGFTFLFSVLSVQGNDLSLAVWITFFSRVFVYVMNSMVGYSTAKTSIETTKYNILSKTNKLIEAFLEINKRVPQEVK